MQTVTFRQMADGTKQEYLLLQDLEKQHVSMTADRVLRELRMADDEFDCGLSDYPAGARTAERHARVA